MQIKVSELPWKDILLGGITVIVTVFWNQHLFYSASIDRTSGMGKQIHTSLDNLILGHQVNKKTRV